MGLQGLGGSVSGFASSDPGTKQTKMYGSGFHNQERSATSMDDWMRSSKVAKTTSTTSNTFLRSNCSIGFLDGDGSGQQEQQMLSFSSPKVESSQNATLLPCFQNALAAYNRSTGYNSGGLNGAIMHGAVTGPRGPFTPSQWMELEHQALIYKYINANVPVPTNLLIPIRKAFDSAAFSAFPAGLLRSNSLGWGSFHLGFSNNADPEPGRCRRTDGKKWRCSRDAVADQKYCERHMNRGRHRSRKPVEGQTGHSVAGATATTSKPMLVANSTSSSSSVAAIPSGGASNSLAIGNQHLQGLEPGASNSSAAAHFNRMFGKDNVEERNQNNQPGLSLLSKQQISYDESCRAFGLVNSDSLLNPSQKNSSFGSSRNLTDRERESQHSLRQFIDDWPKNQSKGSSISWPDLDMQSDRTQLSISIPMTEEKNNLSPLRLSRELDQVPMGLGVGNRQANWIPISWENSLGGPLGEVLHHTNNNTGNENKSSSVLNLMTEGWDNSPPMGSSPTGVLQKTAFGSLSNSSAGSSPRAESNKTHQGVGLCNNLLGSAQFTSSSSLPA
ncbi:hypothetical protein UlMin_034915 [Ulmus minor]